MFQDASTKMALTATLHCLTGCAIGEVSGMVAGSALGLGPLRMVVLSVALAFMFGYGLTWLSLRRAGLSPRRALGLALASDTLSIATMEITDNLTLLILPGALTTGLASVWFWLSLTLSLALAFIVTVPVNRWLIQRGRGHAVLPGHHQ